MFPAIPSRSPRGKLRCSYHGEFLDAMEIAVLSSATLTTSTLHYCCSGPLTLFNSLNLVNAYSMLESLSFQGLHSICS